ncbi:MAG TPA: NADH-ubiquinone oxidoreductase-F iron-sulfur binding region domain-containing protein [Acidimicrobiales bacterium]|nr:NADH-ubiquinone oxidoreductase-F iron-sulfur binding region domain-containing protein [Acidimicrobiales bacterium]
MSVMTPPTVGLRLLAGAPADGGPPTWRDHLATHGPLPLAPGDPVWAASVRGAIEASGIRGRGGAQFPSSVKLEGVRRANGRPVLVVNAMEGEPASAKDKVLLSLSPHLVLDGAELMATLAGARRTVVCLEASNPALGALGRALAERGGRWAADVEVLTPPGGYVAGEESALVAWIDRGEGLPSFRPDKSSPMRIGRAPVLVNNAETLAHVALIARHGADWFAAAGTPEAPGTTLVTVTGAVAYPGVLEVEVGTPVADILRQAGATAGIGAVLVGGYAGTWLAPHLLDTPFDPRSLAAVGAVMGVGSLVVLASSSCGITETARIAAWMAGESAGQCGPCVFGLPAVASDLELVSQGVGGRATLQRLTERCRVIAGRGACRHPDGVIRLVESALTVFGHDVASHTSGRPCAGRTAATWMTFPASERRPVWP